MRAVAPLLALIAFGGPAHAQLRGIDAAASLSYDLDYLRVRSSDTNGETLQWVAAGVGLRGFVGKRSIGYGLGLDFRLGGGLSGGFAYEADLYPAGIGLGLGRHGVLTLVGGVGVSGLTDRIPFGVQFPVELAAEFQLGARLHVAASASARWIAADDARQAGAPTLPIGDELTAAIKLRLNARFDRFEIRSGNGYFVAALYQERLGAQFLGAAIGYSISAWTL